MRATFFRVLQEVLTGLLITESNVNRGDRIRRGRRTKTLTRIPAWSKFALECHNSVYLREREKEKNTITTRYRNERIRMDEICMNM